MPESAPPLAFKVLAALRTTVLFAAAAMSLSIVVGILRGFLGSTAWWAEDPMGGRSRGRLLGRGPSLALYGGTRMAIALMRSVHAAGGAPVRVSGSSPATAERMPAPTVSGGP